MGGNRQSSIVNPMIHLGHNHYVLTARIITVLNPNGNSMRRLREQKYSQEKIIDMTAGDSTASMVLLDDGILCLSAVPVIDIVGAVCQCGETGAQPA